MPAAGRAPARRLHQYGLTSIDLAAEKVVLADHELRLQRLPIKQGGVPPWHSPGDRPALIY